MNRPPLSVLAGFALGLLSLYFQAVTGVPALLLSFIGLRAVNESDGKLPGARLAAAGLVLGGIGTLITAVGFLAILFLKMETTSEKAGCMYNLRLIGMSLKEYADAHGTFPPATRDPAVLPPEKRLSWLSEVLPLLAERTKANAGYRALAERLDRSAAWDAPANAAGAVTVRPFLCPGHSPPSPGLTHYVGLAGVFGHDRGLKREDVMAGESYTLAVMETAADNGPWIAGGAPTLRSVPDGERLIGPGRPFGGLHRGYAHGLFLDASVRTFRDDVPGELLRRLARLRERE